MSCIIGQYDSEEQFKKLMESPIEYRMNRLLHIFSMIDSHLAGAKWQRDISNGKFPAWINAQEFERIPRQNKPDYLISAKSNEADAEAVGKFVDRVYDYMFPPIQTGPEFNPDDGFEVAERNWQLSAFNQHKSQVSLGQPLEEKKSPDKP